ncbi:MAG TPA: biotin/lipoyl-containing protein [Candidatus Limnocylindrales bacterium]|nr:biotin/lipoyl-containing protein [Candidatus Limnocylindrales bacterium]
MSEPEVSPTAVPRAGSGEGDDVGPEDVQSLIALVERLSRTLERSDLLELEVEAGGTSIVLRKPAAIDPGQPAQAPVPTGSAASAGSAAAGEPEQPSVKAPLTGIWYAAPAPGSAPYVRVGGEIAVGQVIGLIEAMKLFNEIKSDLAGRVVRVVPETGTLVKAKQPLLEVDPL